MKDKLILMIAFCLLPAVTLPQVLTLDSLLMRIENNNPSLLSYAKKMSSADEMANGARALPAPKAGVMFDDNPYDFGFGTKVINFSLSQSFPNTAELNAKENYLKSISDITYKESEQLKNQIFANAKIKYYERFTTEQNIKVLRENIRLMKSMIEISEKQMAGGMGELSSIYKMKARLSDAETMLEREVSMIRSVTVELNYYMAADLNDTFSIDTANMIKDYSGIPFLAERDQLESSRSDIQKMSSEITSMKLNKEVVSAMSKPGFELTARHYAISGEPDMYAVEAMVMIPIAPWSSKGYKSEVKSMSLKIEAMEQDKQAMINMASQMVSKMSIELNSKRKEVENYSNKVIPAYKKSFEANMIAYRENTGELMKIILAWDDLLMAQMQYNIRLGELLKLQAEYEREMQIR